MNYFEELERTKNNALFNFLADFNDAQNSSTIEQTTSSEEKRSVGRAGTDPGAGKDLGAAGHH